MSTERVEIELRLTGNASQQFRGLMRGIQRETSQINRDFTSIARQSGIIRRNLAGLAGRAFGNLSLARRDMAGLAASSGTANRNLRQSADSAARLRREAAGAAQAVNRMGASTQRNTRELERQVTQLTRMQKLAGAGMGLASVGMGLGAAADVLKDPIKIARDLELWAARQSNVTIGRDLTKPGYQADVVERRRQYARGLINEVNRTATAGGTTLEAGQAIYARLIAAGIYNASGDEGPDAANRKRAMLQQDSLLASRISYMSGGQAEDSAATILQARHRGLDPARLGAMAVVSAQEGSFELKNLDRYLPVMMAYAGERKHDPYGAMAELFAAAQVIARQSGTPNEAGVGAYNLLKKMTDNATQNNFGKYNIDYGAEMVKGALAGKKPIQVAREQTQRVWGMSPVLNELQGSLKRETDPIKRNKLMDAIAAEQSNITGRLFREQRSGRSMRSILLNVPEMERIKQAAMNPGAVLQENSAVMMGTADSGFNAAANANAINQYNAFGGMAGTLGELGKQFASLSQEYPGLAAGLTATGIGAKAATAGMIAAAGASWLLARAAGFAAGSQALGGLSQAAGGAVSGLATFAKYAAGLAGAGYAGWEVGSYINKQLTIEQSDSIGRGISSVMGFFGNRDAQESIINDAGASASARAYMRSRRNGGGILSPGQPVQVNNRVTVQMDGRRNQQAVERRQTRDVRRGGGAGGQW